ncbi:MAG: S24/S26 family peptidase [Bacteroidales bacterium]|nr:S24/S26 family peptidase [Bacteroidales bacterium]
MDKRVLPNEVLLEEAGKLLDEGRDVTFTPLGSSMLPFIHGGKDSVTLRKMPSAQVGDIVLVRLPGRYVLHRIIALEGEKVTLMGDGNLVGTENCRLPDIMGTVTAIQKGKRSVTPGKGRFWRALKPFRRYILAIYRRLI